MNRIQIPVNIQGWETIVELHPVMIEMIQKCRKSVQSVMDDCDHVTQNYCLKNGGAQYVVEEMVLVALAYSKPE